jgi:hypothetical protein
MSPFKNSRFVTGAVSVALAVSLFGGATFAQASTLTTAQIQSIIGLLQSFGADSATVASVQSILTNQPNGSGSSGEDNQGLGATNCATLTSNLQPGSTDQTTNGAVSRLQSFLGKDKSIFPEDAVTGFFGTSTLRAVQRWQAARGIISSGDPKSTGFGNVGPRTRAGMDKEIEMECTQGDSSNSSSGGN